MSIWNKILVGLLIAVAPVLFYTASRSLQTYAVWQDAAKKYEKRIEYYQNELAKVEPQVDRLHVQLYGVLADRHRAWFRCDPKLPIKTSRDDGMAEVSVAIEAMVNHGIAKATVLHVFETPNEAGVSRYLGEFAATNVGDRQVTLVPTSKLSSGDFDLLEKAKKPWTLYEILPHDNHEIFASQSEEQLKKNLPVKTVLEYLKDGKPAEPADPKDCVQDDKYVRQLRDYEILFSAERKKALHLRQSLVLLERDNKQLAEASDDASKEEIAGVKDVARAKDELKEREYERDAVATLFKSFEKATADAQAAIEQLVKQNKVMAGQIAKYQVEAVERIDQRSQAMAQTGNGGI